MSTATRARLRAVRDNRPKPPSLPYTWHFVHHDGLWTLVLRVHASGQVLRISYATRARPDDATGASVAARLYAMRREG